ncbi:hypothetical protein EC991_007761 [Linnemannia zychae]|nr:hypothetical protein EC991_007761 [Linnemannia zychae]
MVFGCRRRAYTSLLVVVLLALLLPMVFSVEGAAHAKDKDKDQVRGSKDVQRRTGRGAKGQGGKYQDPSTSNRGEIRNRQEQKAMAAKDKEDKRKHANPMGRKEDKIKKQDDNSKQKKDKKKGKVADKKKDKKDNERHGGRQSSLSVDVPCGPGRSKCPSDRPCCSQWGYCGSDADYCLVGCQEAFGHCRLDASSPSSSQFEPADVNPKKPHHHHHHKKPHGGKVRQGFNLQEKQRQYPNQDGRRYRIPATIPKLPLNNNANTSTLVNIAYFPGWTQYRGQGRNNCHQRPYLPSSIPWSSLDYVMFAFAYFDDFHQLYPADASDEALYFEINRLKMATGTRVMVSIGGWSFTHPENKHEASTKYRFEKMIATPASRKAFIDSCIEFCQFYGFDGVDIDYEYPAFKDRGSVTALFKEMREAFDAEGSMLVLSLAGASFQEGIQGFDLEKVSAYTDFVMIMSYDLYGAYDSVKVVNIHTALIQMPTEKHSGHSVQGAIELYLDSGVPRNKIVVGLALYGKTFILSDVQNTLPGRATFKDGGDPTSCIETRGDMAYNELASLIHPTDDRERKVTPLWDNDGKAFYFVYGNAHRRDNWVGYDDRPSLDLKLQMVTELDLAGVMWWSLDQDLDSTSDSSGAALWNRKKKNKKGKKAKARGEDSVHRKRAIPLVPYGAHEVGQIQGDADAEAQVEPSQQQLQGPAQVPLILEVSDASPSAAESVQAAEQAFFATPEVIAEQGGPGAVKSAAAVQLLATPPAAAVQSCPQVPTTPPPASLASIPLDILGRPGLVPYVASKRQRCPVVINHPLILPETPVGNTVVIKCTVPPGCQETWQAYTCLPEQGERRWSEPSPCYGKAQLSPSLYFYGELELVRTQGRDRNIDDGNSASSVDARNSSMGAGPGTSSSPGSNKMSSQIGPARPQYIEEYQKFSKLQKLLGETKARVKSKGKKGHGFGSKTKKNRKKKTL